MLRHDESKTIERLGQLPRHLQVAFALLCSLRLLPAYRRFAQRTGRGSWSALSALSDQVWLELMRQQRPAASDLKDVLDKVMALIPTEEDGWDEETQAYAEDAAAALAYAIRTALTGEPQEAAWSARRAYESADHRAQAVVEISPGDQAAEMAILAHPVVQTELRRQDRDLAELAEIAAAKEPLARTRLDDMRQRADAEGEATWGGQVVT